MPERPVGVSEGANETPPPILADTWYAHIFGDLATPLSEAIADRWPRPVVSSVARVRVLRGIATATLARHRAIVVTNAAEPGALTFLTLESLLGRRRVVLLELIGREPPTRVFRRLLYQLWFSLVVRPAIRRTVIAAQVMTEWEGDEYARRYGLSRERLVFLPWPRHGGDGPTLDPIGEPVARKVISTGRAYCDWETLFAAAHAADWELTVVCAGKDLESVRALNRHGSARVLSDIPFEEHQRLLRESAVYVLCLLEAGASAGQVRLRHTTSAGVAVVATRTRGLEGYVVDGKTALLVPPRDATALRRAVALLLSDGEQRDRLRRGAREYGASWTYEQYLDGVRELGLKALSQRPLTGS